MSMTTSPSAGVGSGTSAQLSASTSPGSVTTTACMSRTLRAGQIANSCDPAQGRSTMCRVTDTPLYQRVERTVPRLARKMIETFVAEIPLYGLLPREQLEGEILSITEENLRLFFRTLRSGEALTSTELGDVRLSAARRAEERVPLDAVLTAYHVGARIGWEALVEGAQPDETDAVIAAGARVLSYAQQVTAEVAAAYLEEQQTIYGEERDARRALASAPPPRGPADSLAARLGVSISAAYVVVALRVDAHPDEADRGVGGAIAARRKGRRGGRRAGGGGGRGAGGGGGPP